MVNLENIVWMNYTAARRTPKSHAFDGQRPICGNQVSLARTKPVVGDDQHRKCTQCVRALANLQAKQLALAARAATARITNGGELPEEPTA